MIGLGVIGAAALYSLARRGAAPVGIDQFPLPHTRGSSHGRSRALSLYYQAPYLELALRSRERWQDIQRMADSQLFFSSGMVVFDHPGTPAFVSTVDYLDRAGVPHEVLSPAELMTGYPALRLPNDTIACCLPTAGFLDADRCVQALLTQAKAAGAKILPPEQVALDLSGDAPTIVGQLGQRTHPTVIVAPGPWANTTLTGLSWPLRISRQHTCDFTSAIGQMPGPDLMPVVGDRTSGIYCFPHHAGGIKVALDRPGATTDPNQPQPHASAEHIDMLRSWLDRTLAGYDPVPGPQSNCFYTNTPDRDFIVGRHPAHPRVLVAAGFSGHGFKFAPVIGEALADLAMNGETGWQIGQFNPGRFATRQGSC